MINTLEGLVDYINGEDFNMLVVNKIIEENGWRDTSGISDYDVCQSGSRKVVLDDNTGEAKIVSIDAMWLLGKAVAIIKHVCDAPARLKTSRLHTAGFRIHLNPVL